MIHLQEKISNVVIMKNCVISKSYNVSNWFSWGHREPTIHIYFSCPRWIAPLYSYSQKVVEAAGCLENFYSNPLPNFFLIRFSQPLLVDRSTQECFNASEFLITYKFVSRHTWRCETIEAYYSKSQNRCMIKKVEYIGPKIPTLKQSIRCHGLFIGHPICFDIKFFNSAYKIFWRGTMCVELILYFVWCSRLTLLLGVLLKISNNGFACAKWNFYITTIILDSPFILPSCKNLDLYFTKRGCKSRLHASC